MIIQNSILRSLPHEELKAIAPYISSVGLKDRSVIHELGEPIRHVYFIESGVVSLMNATAGSLMETATAGRRGAAGGTVALEAMKATHRSIVLIEGRASRIATEDLMRFMTDGYAIRKRLMQNAMAVLIHGSQTALCAARHELEQRLSSWLAITSDALEGGPIAMTHERMSDVLGLRRAGLTEALAELEASGIIRKSRGLIQIVLPVELKRRACDCYRIIANGYRYDDHARHFRREEIELRL